MSNSPENEVSPSPATSRTPTLFGASLPPSHNALEPDLSYPTGTGEVERVGVTNEYRAENKTGLVPLPEETLKVLNATGDPEKGRKFGKDIQLVVWKDNDPEDPRNWSKAYRWYITAVAASSVVSVAFASSVVTGDFKDIQSELHMGEVVVALSVSLMVVGFGIGPLVYSPLSELYGRRWVWIFPYLVYVLLNIPCALAYNTPMLLICRFWCGVMASAPLTLAGGTISDIWDNSERGFAIALFAAAPYSGPVLGPIVGGFVGETVGWRWILWVNMIYAGVQACFIATIPETFAPVILRKRAEKLRAESGRDDIFTQQELTQPPFAELIKDTLIRPFVMLLTEPILLLMSMYISIIYGLLYGFFFSFPIIFGEGYHFNDGIVGLTFISVLIGVAIALIVTPKLEKIYNVRTEARGGKGLPEDRLVGAMIAAPFVPISLFIFGWTSPPFVQPGGGNWVGPCISGIPFGFAMVVIYFCCNAYLIDAFASYVASALAAKTVLRSGMGAAVPLFVVQMYHGIGNGWAASVFAFVSLAIMPIPFIFYKYGTAIRSRSKLASSD